MPPAPREGENPNEFLGYQAESVPLSLEELHALAQNPPPGYTPMYGPIPNPNGGYTTGVIALWPPNDSGLPRYGLSQASAQELSTAMREDGGREANAIIAGSVGLAAGPVAGGIVGAGLGQVQGGQDTRSTTQGALYGVGGGLVNVGLGGSPLTGFAGGTGATGIETAPLVPLEGATGTPAAIGAGAAGAGAAGAAGSGAAAGGAGGAAGSAGGAAAGSAAGDAAGGAAGNAAGSAIAGLSSSDLAQILNGIGTLGGIWATAAGSDAMADAARYAADLQQGQYEQTRADLEPWRQIGIDALGRLNGLYGFGDQSGQPQQSSAEWLGMDPGYEFRLQEGENALARQQAAAGSRFSGNALRAASEYGQNFASNEFNNAYNRLAGLSGTGQVTTNQIANYGAQNANNQANAMQNAANARASGYVGMANTLNQGIGQGYGIWQNNRLLSGMGY